MVNVNIRLAGWTVVNPKMKVVYFCEIFMTRISRLFSTSYSVSFSPPVAQSGFNGFIIVFRKTRLSGLLHFLTNDPGQLKKF